jgi:hypothetical protein
MPRRDELRAWLKQCGIETLVHYPVPVPMQPAMRPYVPRGSEFPAADRASRELLSLPLYPDLTEAETLLEMGLGFLQAEPALEEEILFQPQDITWEYLKGLEKISLLTPEKEVDLAKRIKEGERQVKILEAKTSRLKAKLSVLSLRTGRIGRRRRTEKNPSPYHGNEGEKGTGGGCSPCYPRCC